MSESKVARFSRRLPRHCRLCDPFGPPRIWKRPCTKSMMPGGGWPGGSMTRDEPSTTPASVLPPPARRPVNYDAEARLIPFPPKTRHRPFPCHAAAVPVVCSSAEPWLGGDGMAGVCAQHGLRPPQSAVRASVCRATTASVSRPMVLSKSSKSHDAATATVLQPRQTRMRRCAAHGSHAPACDTHGGAARF